ncbi:hypothetical protein PV721_17770 [Streptomyces sp. MB09-01]|uniref:DUF6197 family protein n=1 Tax=Streptomyces sp. MB09-01 TaxID=3028666 RepID=UPI0029AB21D3|nr:hypothetical protein [Streptomyces sp. MB09-01]MDX3536188.1 hypothetical protein [Streptomyces sp. MB09-01]
MSTRTLPSATPHLDDLDVTADVLVGEIERYLAARVRTAHPLVTKTTAELVAEALGELAASPAPVAAPAPQLRPPAALLRHLPDWCLSLPVVRAWHGGGRYLTAAESLELTALVIEAFGWARGSQRDHQGGRCIFGAQYALHRLGYGDVHTMRLASGYLQNTLGAEAGSYQVWNSHPDRTREQVLALVRAAAANARRDGQ